MKPTDMHLTDRLSLTSVPIPMPRGVHSYLDRRRRVYYAITSAGRLLHDELRPRLDEEPDAAVERELWTELDRADPVTGPPRLALYVSRRA